MAVAPKKGVGPSPDDIMAGAAMKPLLMLSKREPVNAALGLTADKLGVVLLHKKMKPKKVLATLKTEAKKVRLDIEMGSLRFGTAEVDPEIDSALVRFRVNKEPPGLLGPKVRDCLKKAGFMKVEFIVDPSLEDELEEEEAGASQPPEPGGPLDDAAWKQLTMDLLGLAKQIVPAAAGDAGRQQAMLGLANAANAAIKARQDPGAADQALTALRQALAGAGSNGSAGPRVKATPVWQEAKDATDDQLRALSDQLRKTGIPVLAEVANDVETLLQRVRVELVSALLAYDDAPGNASMRTAALAAVGSALEWLGSDPRIAEVDANPFGVTVTAGSTLGSALRRLQSDLGAEKGVRA